MPLTALQNGLELETKKRIELRLNNNRSTMLSVKWEPNKTKISLHKFFLTAPQKVLESLVKYIKCNRRKMTPDIKSFIEENIRKLDYSHTLDKGQLKVHGKYYNLQKIFDELNSEYFSSKLNLYITWFQQRASKRRSQVTFGTYNEPLKLIKINQLLDSNGYPDYFVSYVIFHEMLHGEMPCYYDKKGRLRVHHKEFKLKEECFRDYDRAKIWIKNNRENILGV